jgi:hypothetical protein
MYRDTGVPSRWAMSPLTPPRPPPRPPPTLAHASKPIAPATSKRTPPGATRWFAADLDELAAAAELLVLDPEVWLAAPDTDPDALALALDLDAEAEAEAEPEADEAEAETEDVPSSTVK